MGRPSEPKNGRRAGVSRRDFLRRAAAVPALVAAQPFLAGTARADDVSLPPPEAGTGPFVHGVASGDPLSDRVILWTRVTLPRPKGTVSVSYVVALDTGLRQVVATGQVGTDAKRDYTVKVDVTGLTPATTYYYQFTYGTVKSRVGRTRTLPVGSVDRLRIAVVSCASLAHGYFNVYRQISFRADLDLVVHLGDYIYEFGDGEYGNVRSYEPPSEIVTLHEYRTRHNQYKADRDLIEMHRQHPVIAIWDDHEIADNAWKGGAENHDPELGEGAYGDRVKAAVRAYHEWMPIRPPSSDPKRIYRSFRIGDLAELFMLEGRLTARAEPGDPNVTSDVPLFTQEGEFVDPRRELIGATQQDWLVNGLRRSTAQWKLIGQGVMVAPARAGITPEGESIFFNPDQWDGYAPARERLLSAIAGPGLTNPVQNAVVLTGDIHSSWASDVCADPYGGDYDPGTGEGSIAVEFVGTSVTSPGQSDPDGRVAQGLRFLNPHIKYVELTRRGYLLLDITSARASAEWWYTNTIAVRDTGQSFGTAFQTLHGSSRITPGTRSTMRPDAPPRAP
jgi:alkaline phosphatase D